MGTEEMEAFKNSEFAKQILDSIESDLELINNRKKSLSYKLMGDQGYEEGNYSKAISNYQKAIETDPFNEKALANLALILLKKNEFTQVVDLCNRAIGVIMPHLEFNQFTSMIIQSSSVAIPLLSKIYLRRAQAKYSLKELESAKDDIRNLLLIDERNEPARKLQSKLKIEVNLKKALEKKEIADKEFKEKKIF